MWVYPLEDRSLHAVVVAAVVTTGAEGDKEYKYILPGTPHHKTRCLQ